MRTFLSVFSLTIFKCIQSNSVKSREKQDNRRETESLMLSLRPRPRLHHGLTLTSARRSGCSDRSPSASQNCSWPLSFRGRAVASSEHPTCASLGASRPGGGPPPVRGGVGAALPPDPLLTRPASRAPRPPHPQRRSARGRLTQSGLPLALTKSWRWKGI